MEISEAEAVHVAKLARLDLEDHEVKSLAADMTQILGYVAKLEQLDTDDVPPTTSVVLIESSLRKDEVTEFSSPDDALANAPEAENNHFVVPSIIE